MLYRFTDTVRQINEDEYVDQQLLLMDNQPFRYTKSGKVCKTSLSDYIHLVPVEMVNMHPKHYAGHLLSLTNDDGDILYSAVTSPDRAVSVPREVHSTLMLAMRVFFLGTVESRRPVEAEGLPFFDLLTFTHANVLQGPVATERIHRDFLNVASDGADKEFAEFLKTNCQQQVPEMLAAYEKLRVAFADTAAVRGSYLMS